VKDVFVKRWLIRYVLAGPGSEHVQLLAGLKNAGGVQVTRSVWILESDKETAALRDEFNSFLGADDLLWITELG
jgi:hypothetical protein